MTSQNHDESSRIQSSSSSWERVLIAGMFFGTLIVVTWLCTR